MKKNKKDHRILCYIGLVILIILLLLPFLLRIFGKNLYQKQETKKDEVIVLSCNKQNEMISSTFLNNEPQNIEYRIKGDYSSKDETDIETDKVNLMDIIRPHAKIEYQKDDDTTIFKVNVSDLKEVKNYAQIFASIENQTTYYTSQTFSCEKASKNL